MNPVMLPAANELASGLSLRRPAPLTTPVVADVDNRGIA